MRVVVIGGGYAGLPCLIELHRQQSDVELHLVDPRSEHCRLTRLHETLQTPLRQFCEPFADLGAKYSFRHHREAVDITEDNLRLWSETGRLPLAEGELRFDALVVATGARPIPLPAGENVFTEEDFRKDFGREVVEEITHAGENSACPVTVVGAGATGVQFLFELDRLLKETGMDVSPRLISLEKSVLPEQPAGVRRVVQRRLAEAGIEHLPRTRYLEQKGERLRVEDLERGETLELVSCRTLLFPGVCAFPEALSADRYGRVLVEKPLQNIFAAGDCSVFQGKGLNRLSAQAALRKGKLVAMNLLAHARGKEMKAYTYKENGYMVSLGRHDAAGWLAVPANIVTGVPAVACKEALETQYNLYLGGVDTYLPFFSII